MTSWSPKRLECIKDLIKTARNSRFSTLRKLATDDQGRNYIFFPGKNLGNSYLGVGTTKRDFRKELKLYSQSAIILLWLQAAAIVS